MAKFLNKKEQVYDLKLTSYGNYLLSIGKFKPIYYQFFDDNILYDGRYAMYTGSIAPEKSDAGITLRENQNEVHKRIKEETQYLESLVLFEEVENNIGKLDTSVGDQEEATYAADETPTMTEPRLDIFKSDQGIGDAFLNAGSQVAPAWKIIAIDGIISSSAVSDIANNIKIPQINMTLNYRKKIVDGTVAIPDPTEIAQLNSRTTRFIDNNSIEIVSDDALIYAEEINTMLLTENFDIEVFDQTTEDAENAEAQLTINAEGSDLNGETFTINDGTNSVTFTFTTGTVNSATKIDATSPSALGFIAMATRATNVINNYVLENDLNVSAASSLNILIITNTNGIGKKTNTEGTSALLTSSDEDKIETAGGFFTGGKNSKIKLQRKYFRNELPQVIDGMMVAPRPTEIIINQIETGSIEYYFDITVDKEIPAAKACLGAEIFNKESYYVDLDFDCSAYFDAPQEDPAYFDIYGPVTEPELCQD